MDVSQFTRHLSRDQAIQVALRARRRALDAVTDDADLTKLNAATGGNPYTAVFLIGAMTTEAGRWAAISVNAAAQVNDGTETGPGSAANVLADGQYWACDAGLDTTEAIWGDIADVVGITDDYRDTWATLADDWDGDPTGLLATCSRLTDQ